MEHVQGKIKFNFLAVLPQKNALQQSLKDYTQAVQTIQKFWRQLKGRKTAHKIKILKCKIRCLAKFIFIFKVVQKNRNLLFEDLGGQWYNTAQPNQKAENPVQ